jgi:hypothetical protein
MKTDVEIKCEGVKALIQVLGPVDAERFVALVNRDRFDYTLWRQTQWPGETVASLGAAARALRETRTRDAASRVPCPPTTRADA